MDGRLAIPEVISDSVFLVLANVFREEGFIGTTGRIYRSILQVSELPAEFSTFAERCNAPAQVMRRLAASLATLSREGCDLSPRNPQLIDQENQIVRLKTGEM
jgi:hypothetical protein